MVLRRAYSQALDQDSAEQIRRREVSGALRKMYLSPEEEQAIERLSYSLVAKLLLGPISEVVARAGIQGSCREQGADRAVSTSK
jgi:glutamyl-tRNA reductase